MDAVSDADTESRKGPPKPQFALAVGIIGHRPGRLPKADERTKLAKIESDVGAVLDAIAAAARQACSVHSDLFAKGEPVLTMVSALAEGADTIAAKAALKRNFKLDAPLPFPTAEYEKDFHHTAKDASVAAQVQDADRASARALADFKSLKDQARAVLELPGTRGTSGDTDQAKKHHENRAYESVGLTVLSQADIVMAIWDGGPSQGRGGTPELIIEAARTGIPVIVIDAKGEKPPQLRWRNLMRIPAPIVAIDDLSSANIDTSIGELVDILVRLPASSEQHDGFAKWFDEGEHAVNGRFGFPLLMQLTWVRNFRVTDFRPRSIANLIAEYEQPIPARLRSPAVTAETADAQARVLSVPYAWADSVGLWCAQIFRSAFVLNFLFAAVAVFAAAAGAMFLHGGTHHADESFLPRGIVIAEIALIFLVMLNTEYGRRRRWHRRWFESREMAERLRIALPLWALGLRPDLFPGEEAAWTGWYVRAFVRMQGLRSGDFANGRFQAARDLLLGVLEVQCGYNASNAHRMHKLETRLEWAGATMFFLTLLVAADHFFGSHGLERFLGVVGWSEHAHGAAVWIGAGLPALATATYGIRVIGDLEGIAHRAERTHKALDQLIKAVKDDPEDLMLLRARARSATDIMLGDVSSWRLSAESRGLAIPG